MKCIRCGKPLTKPALTVPAKDGPLYMGPRCAATAFPKPKRVRVPKPAAAVLVEVDPRQMALELEAV